MTHSKTLDVQERQKTFMKVGRSGTFRGRCPDLRFQLTFQNMSLV
jgi:hypothetical protein